jgi:uncharacterized protein DUF4245
MRDMVAATLLLVLIVGGVAAVTRGCTFSPGGPTVDPNSAPSVDAARELATAATNVDFPIRQPSLPEGWRANSSSTSPVGSGAKSSVVVRVGWLTPQGRFTQLSQSAAEPREVLATETGRHDAARRGVVDVGSQPWTSYPSRQGESAWVTQFDGVTVVITGNGSEEEFRVLAAAMAAAKPLPRSR